MSESLPTRNLVKLNIVLSVLLSVVFCVFLLAITKNPADTLVRFIQISLFIGLAGFLNLCLHILFARRSSRYLTHDQFLFYSLSYCVAILVWLLVRYFHMAVTGLPWEGEGENMLESYSLAILAVSAFNTLILMLQNLVILQHRKARSEIENLQLKAYAGETRNLLLSQQIHPHFLFNALNTVKSLYKRDVNEGERYLVHLANFLRVAVSNHGTTTTLIKNELDFCLNYLQMQQVRFGSALTYSVALSDHTVNSGFLPFFSLQPLVENALKHNLLTEEKPIKILIDEHEGYIRVSNNLQVRAYKEPSTGQGLSNLTERYRLLGAGQIGIESGPEVFRVSIKILNK
ncbi:sensor histidine kinase [Dyadobacter endophyticus]|uniref:sensor histidine kinase n=1 Tax=Dyadobacter endophyticus TaxID=1749036 RepID=UPI003CEE2664